MKKIKTLKLIQESIEKIIRKNINEKELINIKRHPSYLKEESELKNIDYQIIECESMINFKVNFKLNKANYLSDVETYEIVKFLIFLDKVKRNIIDHLELEEEKEDEEEDEDDEEEENKRERIGFKTNWENQK